jgi:hypothetical protein
MKRGCLMTLLVVIGIVALIYAFVLVDSLPKMLVR